MESDVYRRIESSPKFRELVGARTRFAVTLTVIMLAIYCGFILAVAFAPGWLGAPVSDGSVVTVGIPVGVAVIISAFVLTGIYVARANSRFDQLNAEILQEVR
jgi:uncharacterized membrane protein (DUF485 family)